MSRLLYRLGRGAATRRWTTVAVWLAVVVALIGGGAALGGTFEDDFSLPGADSQQAYDVLAERFPAASGTWAFVVFATPSAALDTEDAAISTVLDGVAKLDHVVDVTHPLETPGSVSPDGSVGYSLVSYDRSSGEIGVEAFEELADHLAGSGSARLQVEIGGELAGFGGEPEAGSSELVGLLAAVVILLLAFGSVVAMGLPIGTALVGLAAGFGVVAILSAVVGVPEIATVLATMIGLGVGIDYALFIVTRYRQNLEDGMDPLHAVGVATATAGQAVVFAGSTVVIAILGLWISGIAFVGMMGTVAAVVVTVTVITAVTLLPALLGFAGRSIDRLGMPWVRRGTARRPRDGVWVRWGREVERRPWVYLVAGLALLGALAVPMLSMDLGMTDDGSAPTSESRRRAYDLLADGFGPGFNGPLLLAVELDTADAGAGLPDLGAAIAATPGVAAVAPPRTNPAGDAAVIQIVPATAAQDPATSDLVHHLRGDVIPRATPEGATAHLGGMTATFIDLTDQIAASLPWFIGAVVLLSFLLLMVVFRSLVVPLKAAVLNLLSIGAAYGVIVAVFQWGWGAGLLGLEEAVPVVSFVPMIMFAVLFGLSMTTRSSCCPGYGRSTWRRGTTSGAWCAESPPPPGSSPAPP